MRSLRNFAFGWRRRAASFNFLIRRFIFDGTPRRTIENGQRRTALSIALIYFIKPPILRSAEHKHSIKRYALTYIFELYSNCNGIVPSTNATYIFIGTTAETRGIIILDFKKNKSESSDRRLSLNRSQYGGCSTEYDTPTSN